jgi:site-specific recombinase XerD
MQNSTEIGSEGEVRPQIENGTVPPARQTNASVRSREYLTDKEVTSLMKAAGNNRQGHRDATMILLTYRHSLRVCELVDLRWTDIDFHTARVNIRRAKGSISGAHPLLGDELRALRQLKREDSGEEFVFMTERGAPFTTAGFRKLLSRLAIKAGLKNLKVHPHMLRHATGYTLANKGTDTRTLQEYMGHRNIQNTVGYTALNASRFKNLWTK